MNNEECKDMTLREWDINKQYEGILEKDINFVMFRGKNKEKLKEDTKEFICLLKLYNDTNKNELYLGILQYDEDSYPILNGKKADKYNEYNVENYIFIEKTRGVNYIKNLIKTSLGYGLKEEDIVLNIIDKKN